jgi:diguanylate cyclase (GGDEF)-like protein
VDPYRALVVLAFDRLSERSLLGLADVAAIAGVHRSTARAWCTSGRLPSIIVNERGERRVRATDLEAFIAARAGHEPDPAIVVSPLAAAHVVPPPRIRTTTARLEGAPEELSRSDALRRIAADVSGKLDLVLLFQHVVDESFALFAVDRAGLWLYDGAADRPLTLAAQRGLSDLMLEHIAAVPREASTAGLEAIRERAVRVLDGDLAGTIPSLREGYLREGIQTICFVPIVYQDVPVALLVLYHAEDYRWTTAETDLVRAFGDVMATAIGNARLFESSNALAERLRAIADLAIRLNRIQKVDEIGETIVTEARRLIDFDTIRVYRVDHGTGQCEPIAFQGRFLGFDRPDPAMLRIPIGVGLTGWVAAHNRPVRIGDAESDPRSLVVGRTEGPESMLIVPMSYDDATHGVIVVSSLGVDRFDAQDETTFSIFASYAAHALVAAANRDRLDSKQAELEHQLTSQRRLLEVNERLLSTLEPAGILELIADSLKSIVPYDTLTIYRADRVADVRRAVVARDRFADLILAHESALDTGVTGWVIDHGEPVLSNEVHLDPRAVQVPSTPSEPKSMIIVPLLVEGEVVGTLNIGRMGADSHFTANEFELTKLFAGQASIALQNAEAHGAVRVRAEHDALTGLRNHGAFQRELGEAVALSNGRAFAVLMLDLDSFKSFNDACGHPAGDALLAEVARSMTSATRDGDRLYRYGGDEFAAILPGTDRVAAHIVAARIRDAVAAAASRAADAAGGSAPTVTITSGVACFPEDGRTKGELAAIADAALYLAKPTSRGPAPVAQADDPYLRALDETALALADRHDPGVLLEAIMTRATALLGTPHGYIYLLEPNGTELVVRHGAGMFVDYLGLRLSVDEGLSGQVYRTAEIDAVDDYTTSARSSGSPSRRAAGRSASSGSPREPAGGRSGRARSTPSGGSPGSPRSPSRTPGCSRLSSAARSTTRSPACRTATSSVTGSTARSALGGTRPPRRSPSPSSTSTGSRSSTRASGTPSGTGSSMRSVSGSSRVSDRATRSPASVAISTPSSSIRSPMPTRRIASPRRWPRRSGRRSPSATASGSSVRRPASPSAGRARARPTSSSAKRRSPSSGRRGTRSVGTGSSRRR